MFSAPRRSALVASFVYLVSASVPARISADDRAARDWYSTLDSDARAALERGMGFVRKFREPGQCKETVDELAGAMTSLSPEVLGAAVGLALGAAAGAASTASLLGALRGGILLGSVGSALGHLADVLVPDRVSALADDVQDLIQARDGKVCELIKASDKLREPVLEHLHTSLERECLRDGDDDAALQRCVRDNTSAAAILERHASVLATIDRGTCYVAASLVKRFERGISQKAQEQGGAAAAGASLSASCDEEPAEAPRDPEPPVRASRPLGKNVL
jgi:hypothetical protein